MTETFENPVSSEDSQDMVALFREAVANDPGIESVEEHKRLDKTINLEPLGIKEVTKQMPAIAFISKKTGLIELCVNTDPTQPDERFLGPHWPVVLAASRLTGYARRTDTFSQDHHYVSCYLLQDEADKLSLLFDRFRSSELMLGLDTGDGSSLAVLKERYGIQSIVAIFEVKDKIKAVNYFDRTMESPMMRKLEEAEIIRNVANEFGLSNHARLELSVMAKSVFEKAIKNSLKREDKRLPQEIEDIRNLARGFKRDSED